MTYPEWKKAFVDGTKNREKILKFRGKDSIMSLDEKKAVRNLKKEDFATDNDYKERFPKIAFDDSFFKLDDDIKFEAAQALEYMRGLFGTKIMPGSIMAVKMKDYGSMNPLGQLKLSNAIDKEDTYLTVCHECIHWLELNQGINAKKLIYKAQNNIGNRNGSKSAEYELAKALGMANFMKYKDNYSEMMAWLFERTLTSSESRLAESVRSVLIERYGV